MVARLAEFFRQNAEWVFISLILGFVIWIVATLDQNPVQQRELNERIRVSFIEDEDVVRSSTAARFVNVTIRAPRTTFDEINSEDILITANLEDLSPGTHNVELEGEIINNDLRGRVIEISPAEISVEVVEVAERLIQIIPEISRSPSAEYIANSPTCNPDQVTVRGPAPEIDRIASAVTRIDLAEATSTVVDDYPIVLFNSNDRPIINLTSDPETVTCNVEVQRRPDTVVVSVEPRIIGDVPEGYRRQNDFVVTPSEVQIRGDMEVIERLGDTVYTEPIDVTGQTENISRVVSVVLPEGVQLVPRTQRITVDIQIVEENLTVNFTDVPIQVLNLNTGTEVVLSPETVNVSITGRRSLVNDLTKEDISITVDLVNRELGRHSSLPLDYELLRESLQEANPTVVIQPSTVNADISEQVIPTPTPTGLFGKYNFAE